MRTQNKNAPLLGAVLILSLLCIQCEDTKVEDASPNDNSSKSEGVDPLSPQLALRKTLTMQNEKVGMMVSAVSVTPDGKYIVAGAGGFSLGSSILYLWDISGNLKHSLTAHEGGIRSMAISPDGRIFTSGNDQLIKTWVIQNDKLVNAPQYTFNVGSSVLSIAAFLDPIEGLPVIVTGGSDRAVKVWDLTNPKTPRLEMKDRSADSLVNNVQAVAVMPDQTKVISGSYDGIVRIWDLEDKGKLMNTFKATASGGHLSQQLL